jgi:hypothetical protein
MSIFHITASPKQLSKLRNGHKVRIKPAVEGEGFNLLVHPDRYDLISRTFDRGSGMEIALSPEEIVANKTDPQAQIEGSGIFGKTGDRLLKKAGIKQLAYKVGDIAKPHLKSAINSALAAASVAQPELSPFAYGASRLAGDFLDHPSKYHNMMSTNVGGPRNAHSSYTLAGQVAQNHLLDNLNQELGTNYGHLAEANLANSMAHMARSSYDRHHITGRGFGLRREVDSVGRGASMVGHQKHLPPALQSQPFSANFHMQLPPFFQKYSRGSGLFA